MAERTSDDSELKAIAAVIDALTPLDDAARARVVDYVFRRLGLPRIPHFDLNLGVLRLVRASLSSRLERWQIFAVLPHTSSRRAPRRWPPLSPTT